MDGNANIISKVIRKPAQSRIETALTFYRFITAFYNIHLSEMEVGVLAYTALYGTISTPPAREEFIKRFDSSKASLNNLISRLQKRDLLIKDDKLKIRVREEINMDFSKDEYIFKVNMRIKEGENEA